MGIAHKTHFRLDKYLAGDTVPYATEEWDGNSGLNIGLNYLTALLTGSAEDYGANSYEYELGFDHDYVRIWVGDSDAVAEPTQTDLQATENKDSAPMLAGYPISGLDQQIIFKATFWDGYAEFDWNEFLVGRYYYDYIDDEWGYYVDIALLRGVSARGIKGIGEDWTLTITVTLT
jgi:hypothetical protein